MGGGGGRSKKKKPPGFPRKRFFFFFPLRSGTQKKTIWLFLAKGLFLFFPIGGGSKKDHFVFSPQETFFWSLGGGSITTPCEFDFIAFIPPRRISSPLLSRSDLDTTFSPPTTALRQNHLPILAASWIGCFQAYGELSR